MSIHTVERLQQTMDASVTTESNPPPLSLDWSDLASPVPDGTDGFGGAVAAQLEGLQAEDGRVRARTLAQEVGALAGVGRYGFYDLPSRRDYVVDCREWCRTLPPARKFLVIGIGGSAATTRVLQGLVPHGSERALVLDTVDPQPIDTVMRTWDPRETIVLVISKSGTTLETLSVFACIEAWLIGALGDDAVGRITAICGEEENPLRTHAMERGYAVLSIPSEVGGRFSALTPVGLAPATLLGLDGEGLLQGASELRESTEATTIEDNPALLLALLHADAHCWRASSTLLWPYGASIEALGAWWVQLVGESLGKRVDVDDHALLPSAASGPRDQHSLLQLLMEGAGRSLVTFVRAQSSGASIDIPSASQSMTLAAGTSMRDLLNIASESTRYALYQAGRPALVIDLAASDERSVGAFLFLYEMMVTYWAHLWRVNAFDQPGVQHGKDAARALLTGTPQTLRARMNALADLRRSHNWRSPQ